MKYILTIFCFLLAGFPLYAQTVAIREQGRATSIRGLSVIDDKVIWVSGSKGSVGKSLDGGQSWTWQQVKGFEQSDFRDIEAFSAKEAVIMSSGTPALILKTEDGGINWKVCYRNDAKAYFLDGLAFYSKNHGIAMGDPINGHFVLLQTKDMGNTWSELHTGPTALNTEAAFAASGTSVSIDNKKSSTAIVTGGAVSRLFISNRKLKKWNVMNLPLAYGKASKGGFSLASGRGITILVGGDYASDRKIDSVACYFSGKQTADERFRLSITMPQGYQSCVTYVRDKTFMSTGTSGTNITYDGGINWKLVDTGSYNVCQRAKHGNLIILAGDKGRIAIVGL